jgi:DNA invertase Pin-like site-specific DNA recombinase
VSSKQQNAPEREGLPAQREEQTLAIEERGWLDTGLEWTPTHSGKSVHETLEYADMLAQAGRTFDVLVCAYVSRLGRNAEEQLRTVRLIGEAGASVLFVQENIHTANEQQWSAFASEAVNADAYRRQLKLTMRKTYESRWRRRGLPGGHPPTGYTADWQIDPISAELIHVLYSAYALGNVSQEELATRHGLKAEAVKETLRNRTYMGLAIRHGEERPGTFPAIITAALFDRVAATRADRQRAGGPPARQPSMLQGKLFCVCGSSVRMDGRDGVGQPRVRHAQPCAAWGSQERRQARYYTEPLIQALRQMEWTPSEIERLVASTSTNQAPAPIPMNWARQRKQLADDFAAQRISAADFMGLTAQLIENEQLERDDQQRTARTANTTEETRTALSDFSAFVAQAKGSREQTLWAILTQHYFDRFEHLGEDRIRPVPSAAGARAFVSTTMPSQVALARPEGFARGRPARVVRFVLYTGTTATNKTRTSA